MRRSITLTLVLLVGVIAAPAPVVWAQVDAQAAYEAGKAAYKTEQFTKARDLFLKASQTDTRNPEVFLWLGKAQYQLGAIDEAIAAWSKPLALAPEEPYAKKMLETLRGQLVEVDARISLIEVMVREKLFRPAEQECRETLVDKALTSEQRAKVLTLRARALMGMGRHIEAQTAVHELLAKYPAQADRAQATLLLGQTKIRMGGTEIPKGLALLKEVVTDHAGTVEAATAKYELIVFDLTQAPSLSQAQALAAWIATNPDHVLLVEAGQRLDGRIRDRSDRVSDLHVREGLDPGDHQTDLSGTQLIDVAAGGLEHGEL